MAQVVVGIAPCPSVAVPAMLPLPGTMEGWLCLAAVFLPAWFATLLWVNHDGRRLYDTAPATRQRWNTVALLLPLLGALFYWICRPKREFSTSTEQSSFSPPERISLDAPSHGLRIQPAQRDSIELVSADGKVLKPRDQRGVWAGWPAVRTLLSDAVHHRITEISIEPQRHECVVRWHDGSSLQRYRSLSYAEGQQLIATLKHLGGLPLTKPSDTTGRFSVRGTRGEFDVLIRAAVVKQGDSLRVELHPRTPAAAKLGDLGVPPALEQELRRITAQPTGLILVAGPDALTKTVINSVAAHLAPRLLVTEQPTQPVRAAEITETARFHHLVATPLPTATAVDALTRWVEWHGTRTPIIPPLQLIIAVRPIRWLCTECRAPYRPPPDEWSAFGAPPQNPLAFRAGGCPACEHTGYRRDGALWEWMTTDRTTQRVVLELDTASELPTRITLKSWQLFRADALEKTLQGRISLADATRALATELSHV